VVLQRLGKRAQINLRKLEHSLSPLLRSISEFIVQAVGPRVDENTTWSEFFCANTVHRPSTGPHDGPESLTFRRRPSSAIETMVEIPSLRLDQDT
jgi:hypothetical protein